uniref:Uncharacterized protein n=1 Tax=Panagrolaimus sp. JU765 TaxID=591449 RepID=A0AC34RJD1_9BILA
MQFIIQVGKIIYCNLRAFPTYYSLDHYHGNCCVILRDKIFYEDYLKNRYCIVSQGVLLDSGNSLLYRALARIYPYSILSIYNR